MAHKREGGCRPPSRESVAGWSATYLAAAMMSASFLASTASSTA